MKNRIPLICDFLIGCVAFSLFSILPNHSTGAMEFIVFFYPKSIGFLPVTIVLLRISSRLIFGRTLGELITKKKKELSVSILSTFRLEIFLAAILFTIETIPETILLGESFGLSIDMPASAYIQAPALFLSILIIPISIIYYCFVAHRIQ